MPAVQLPDGRTVYIPGVYSSEEVVSDLPGPTPEFHIPILIGDAYAGYPYDFNADKEALEAVRSPFTRYAVSGDVDRAFGRDSDVAVAFRFAKRHGLPFAYIVVINPLTRAKIVATSTGPVNEQTIYARRMGIIDGHTKLKYTAAGGFIITPVTHWTVVTTTTVSGDKRVYVKDTSWMRVGQTVTIGDNDAANVTKVIAKLGFELTTEGQKRPWVEFTATVGSAVATTQYGVVLDYEGAVPETSGVLADGLAAYNWLNEESELLGSTKVPITYTGAQLIDVASATAIKDISAWGTMTDGTSPASSSTQHDDFIGDLTTAWDQFILDYSLVPQAFDIVSESSTIHASWRDWGLTKRDEGYPVSITVGCGWADIVVGAGNDTAPEFRANALNSQNVMLAACGLDRIDAFLSTSPAVWAMRVRGGVNHNLTFDEFVYSEIEVMWDERGLGQLTTLTRAGVVTPMLRPGSNPRFVVNEGLSTLQANEVVWNVSTDDTALVHQRDLADFVDRVFKEDLLRAQIGVDGVTADSIAAVLLNRVNRTLRPRELIVDYQINAIELNDAGVGYDVDHAISFPVPGDFITLNNKIKVG